MNSPPLISVFGATGAQGGGLVRALLQAPERAFRDFNAEFCAARDVAATRALHRGLMRFADFLARHAAQLPVAPRALPDSRLEAPPVPDAATR